MQNQMKLNRFKLRFLDADYNQNLNICCAWHDRLGLVDHPSLDQTLHYKHIAEFWESKKLKQFSK